MFYQKLKNILNDSLSTVESDIDSFVYAPGKDFSRIQKLSPSQIMSFLISQGGSSSKNECLDFFKLDVSAPSASAINQRRSQLKPSALAKVFQIFNEKTREIALQDEQITEESASSSQSYCFIAADGTTTGLKVEAVFGA